MRRGKTDGFNGGNPCRYFHRLTDGNRYHDPTAYECQNNRCHIGNSIKSLGKQKKTAAYTQHCTNQNPDTAEFTPLPLYNPLDLLWRCTNRPKLPVALDFVIDGDTEDTLDHNIAADQNNGNHASHQCKIKGFRSIGKILAVHFGHRKLIFLRNLPAIRGHQFFAQLVAVFEMDIGAIASRVKPFPFCQGSVGKNDSAGIRFFFIYAVHNAGNDIITMKTLCI